MIPECSKILLLTRKSMEHIATHLSNHSVHRNTDGVTNFLVTRAFGWLMIMLEEHAAVGRVLSSEPYG